MKEYSAAAIVFGVVLFFSATQGFGNKGFGYGLRRIIERVTVPLEQSLVEIRHSMMEPWRWVEQQRRGMDRLAQLEKELAVTISQEHQLAELNKQLVAAQDLMKSPAVKLTGKLDAQLIPTIVVLGDQPYVPVGQEHGVEPHALVISQEGVGVGLAQEVGATFAHLDLFSSFQGKMRVMSQHNKENSDQQAKTQEGVLLFNGKELVVTYLDTVHGVEKETVFVTVGDGKGIPEAVPVVRVVKVLSEPSDPVKTVAVEMIAAPTQHQPVFVYSRIVKRK